MVPVYVWYSVLGFFYPPDQVDMTFPHFRGLMMCALVVIIGPLALFLSAMGPGRLARSKNIGLPLARLVLATNWYSCSWCCARNAPLSDSSLEEDSDLEEEEDGEGTGTPLMISTESADEQSD